MKPDISAPTLPNNVMNKELRQYGEHLSPELQFNDFEPKPNGVQFAT